MPNFEDINTDEGEDSVPEKASFSDSFEVGNLKDATVEKPNEVDTIKQAEKGIFEKLKGKARSLCEFFMILSSAVPLPSLTAKEVANNFSDSKNKIEVPALNQEIIFENSAFKLAASLDKKSKNDPEIAKKIELVHVEAVCDGESQAINFTADDFEKNPSLEVRGFIKNILVLGDEEVEIKFNGKKASQLEFSDRKTGENKIFVPHLNMNDVEETEKFIKSLSDSRVDSAYISEHLKTKSASDKDKILGTAYCGTFEKTENMNPINHRNDNFVEFSGKNGKYVLPIKQEMKIAPEKFSAGRHSVDLVYVGSGIEQFLNDKAMNEKMNNISQAIGVIEDSLSDKKLVEGFEIINTKEKNAQSEAGGYIRLTVGCLNDLDSAEMVNVTEHEVIHRHFQENKLGENIDLRKYFADLRGYEGNMRDDILKEGEIPEILVSFTGADKNEAFFNFIEEKSFFSMSAGHTTADIEEFICSFTHSLIYSDKLESNLSKISQAEGQPSAKDQQLNILDNYEKTILAMLKASNSKKENKFLERKLVEILKLKEKFK